MKRLIFILGALVLLTLVFAAGAHASENVSKVYVGTYILNLGKFDIATGSFTADFYLSLTCDGVCPQQDFEFVNGRATSVDKIIDEPGEKFYRIQANLNSPVDLKSFPFDSQKMEIILEDKKKTREELIYVPLPEESGVDESIAFTGWEMGNWTVEERIHRYEIYDEEYSQYVLSIPINRIRMNSILKTFLPIAFIIFVMLSSFFLDPDKITTRLGMVGSALVASVMFHISISNQIPPVGYLTFADKFMILTYFVLLMSFVMNVFMLEMQEQKKEAVAKRIHRYTEYTAIPIVLLLYTIFIVFVF